jgi:hypothetical protein
MNKKKEREKKEGGKYINKGEEVRDIEKDK